MPLSVVMSVVAILLEQLGEKSFFASDSIRGKSFWSQNTKF